MKGLHLELDLLVAVCLPALICKAQLQLCNQCNKQDALWK